MAKDKGNDFEASEWYKDALSIRGTIHTCKLLTLSSRPFALSLSLSLWRPTPFALFLCGERVCV